MNNFQLEPEENEHGVNEDVLSGWEFIDNRGGFGRWAFLEIADPWDAKNTVRAFVRQKESEQ